MQTLTSAYQSKNQMAVEEALNGIAASDWINVYYTTLVAKLTRTAASPGYLTLSEASVDIVGYLAWQTIPAYEAAGHECKGDHLNRSETVEVCRGVARSFMAGDIFVAEMVGIAIAKRVWPENSPQWQNALEVRRVYEDDSKRFLESEVASAQSSERYLRLCEKYSAEQAVLRASLQETDQPNVDASVTK
jgi:hypothetical protein